MMYDMCTCVQVGITPTNIIDVYNLKPGHGYKFRVTARNRYGWGQPVVSTDYANIMEPKYLPEFRQPLPGETKVLMRHRATLQCHVRKQILFSIIIINLNNSFSFKIVFKFNELLTKNHIILDNVKIKHFYYMLLT